MKTDYFIGGHDASDGYFSFYGFLVSSRFAVTPQLAGSFHQEQWRRSCFEATVSPFCSISCFEMIFVLESVFFCEYFDYFGCYLEEFEGLGLVRCLPFIVMVLHHRDRPIC